MKYEDIIIVYILLKSYKIQKPNIILSSQECLLKIISAIHYHGSGVKQKNLNFRFQHTENVICWNRTVSADSKRRDI